MNKFIIGLILGIAIAGGIAFYLNNAPSQFISKVSHNESGGITTSSSPIILAPGTKLQEIDSAPTTSVDNQAVGSANNASAPDYDFYNILQGKKANASTAPQPAAKVSKYYIQAGAFSDQNLANDMKARLALLGFDALIKSQQDNGKMINRIIVGPLNSEAQAMEIIRQLANDDIKATLIKINN